jgi:hypothetical protein
VICVICAEDFFTPIGATEVDLQLDRRLARLRERLGL